MYSLLIASGAALLAYVGGQLADWWGWFTGLFVAIPVFAAVWILLVRRISKRVQPIMMQVQQQMQAQRLDNAIQSLQAALPLGKWMPMLTGQIYAQMGTLARFKGPGNEDQALEWLQKSSRRSAEGQLMLAAMLHQRGQTEKAIQALLVAGAVNKKHALLHNTRAWLLAQANRGGEGIAVLANYLKKDAANEPTKDNMLRLQNGKKMNMGRFGMEWYALGLERPPKDMGEMRQGRKGFRQAPKNPGKRSGKGN